mgnify:CR=1 FL=1|tara:strand:- start:233 stop:1675 length:1443 start_codon:yes stop_codon:yes gene_type:complete
MRKIQFLTRQYQEGIDASIFSQGVFADSYFSYAGQTLLSRTASLNREAGLVPVRWVGKMETTISSSNPRKGGNLTFVFFGKQSLLEFGKNLFSDEFSTYWRQPWLKKSKPNLEDPIELQNQIIEIFGLDLFKGSVYSLSCEVVSKLSHMTDLCSLDDSTAVFVFGTLGDSTGKGLTQIQTKAPSALVIDFTTDPKQKPVNFTQDVIIKETLLILDFIINGDIDPDEAADTFEGSYRKYLADTSMKDPPIFCSNVQIWSQFHLLHKEHQKVQAAFDKIKQPRNYKDYAGERKNFSSWLELLKAELDQLISQPEVVQNSFRHLAAYWGERKKNPKFRLESENDKQRLGLNLEDDYASIEVAIEMLKRNYGFLERDKNHNRFHGMLSDFETMRETAKFTMFGEWEEHEKQTLCYNYNPLFWESLFELYTLNLSTSKIGVPESANPKLKFWLKPTKVDRINAINVKHRIRRSFVNYVKIGGVLS